MRPSPKLICSFIFTLTALYGFSQEQLGLRLGNYSGISGTLFNPAFNVNSPLVWDVNLIAAGVFAENNYILVKDASLLKIVRSKSGLSFAGSQNADARPGDMLLYDFTTGTRKKEAYAYSFISGPSAMFHLKDQTFGIFFNIRSVMSTNRIPSALGYYNIDALDAGDIIHVDPFKTAGLVWSEVGGNYGRKVFSRGKHTVNGGVSLKFLQGYEAVYFQNHEPVDITLNVDSMRYQHARVTFGLATGMPLENGNQPYKLQPHGYGASLDIGVIYYMSTENKKRPYDWKLGLSLLDFGKIVFTKNAQAHEISTDMNFDFIQGQYSSVQNISDAFKELSLQSLADSNASLVSNHFSIWTPAGISFFAERAITNHIFVNATIVRRLRFSGAVPERDNIWAITPRYEHRWFEVSVPLVLYNDKDLRLGTAVRIGPLTIGSDNLTSWFGSHDFTGTDVYFALKLNPITLKHDSQLKHKGTPSKIENCFIF